MGQVKKNRLVMGKNGLWFVRPARRRQHDICHKMSQNYKLICQQAHTHTWAKTDNSSCPDITAKRNCTLPLVKAFPHHHGDWIMQTRHTAARTCHLSNYAKNTLLQILTSIKDSHEKVDELFRTWSDDHLVWRKLTTIYLFVVGADSLANSLKT